MGRGWIQSVMGIQEGIYDEPWVSYVSDELLNSTPETKITLYVNQLEFKEKLEITKKIKQN